MSLLSAIGFSHYFSLFFSFSFLFFQYGLWLFLWALSSSLNEENSSWTSCVREFRPGWRGQGSVWGKLLLLWGFLPCSWWRRCLSDLVFCTLVAGGVWGSFCSNLEFLAPHKGSSIAFAPLWRALLSPQDLRSLVLSWRLYSPRSSFCCPWQLAAGLCQFQVFKCYVIKDGVSPSVTRSCFGVVAKRGVFREVSPILQLFRPSARFL